MEQKNRLEQLREELALVSRLITAYEILDNVRGGAAVPEEVVKEPTEGVNLTPEKLREEKLKELVDKDLRKFDFPGYDPNWLNTRLGITPAPYIVTSGVPASTFQHGGIVGNRTSAKVLPFKPKGSTP